MPTGYVYELYSDEGTDTYIGSAINISRRIKAHKYRHQKYKNGEYDYCSSYEILEVYGSNTKLRILEEVDYIDADDTLLKQEEQKWIDMSKTCVNRQRAFLPDYLRKEYEKELDKQKYDLYKDKILARNKQKISCECGSTFNKPEISRHRLSLKHQKWVSLQNN